jgi:putative redox protein
MPSTKIAFPGSAGTTLAARLDAPDTRPRAYALFAHCFTCSKDTKAATYIARALVEAGIAVLRFDFTGLGGSEGEFANTNFSSNVEDLVAAAAFMRERYEAPRILVGHSLGGAAVIAAAEKIPEALAVATIGAPCEPRHVKKQFAASVDAINAQGDAAVTLAGRAFLIRKQFLDDLDSQAQRARIAALRRALIVFHSPIDRIVDIDNARRIYAAAKHPKSFVSLDNADHLVSRAEDGLYIGGVLAAWAQRYLPVPAALDRVAAGKVLVAERGAGKFANLVRTADHLIYADEPQSVGGTNTGLSPYDLLAAALGACTSMTLRMYADLRRLPLERVAVEVEHAKIHAQDCAECETKEGKIDRFARTIRLTGALDDAQCAKLLEIADKCPVHRTLHAEVQVTTTLQV